MKYVRSALQVGHKASVVEDAVRAATKKARMPEGAAGLAVKVLNSLAQMPPTALQSSKHVYVEPCAQDGAKVAAEDVFNGPWTHNYLQ